MKLVYLFCITILLVSACQSQPDLLNLSDTVKPEAVPTIDPSNDVLYAAQQNYNKYCAHCHGWAGDGQPQVTIENAEKLGYHTVPRHDEYGHTWQHPDQILFEVVKYGIQNPTNLYPMSPYEENLSDEEIFGVVDYIKGWWTDDQRRHQANLTTQFEENNPFWADENLDEDRS